MVKDFSRYKQTGIVPHNFGRDMAYDHPHTLPVVKVEQMRHIHLGSVDQLLPLNKIQHYRTSDIHLVYCQGGLSAEYVLLMTILSPDAHEQAKSRDIMYRLGKMAELFRSKY